MELILGIALAAFVLAAYARLRSRRTAKLASLDDDAVRRIENEGVIEVDEPLDLQAIDREHRKFFEETWDEPEEY